MTAHASGLVEFLTHAGTPQPQHRPCPRYRLDAGGWRRLGHLLAAHPDWMLLSLWAEEDAPAPRVHAALLDEEHRAAVVASLECPERSFPSLAWARPGANRLERNIRELWNLTPEGLEDERPWLTHDPITPYRFLPVEGWNLHEIPVGPVHAGIIEPGHFRFTCAGETVVRLEERLGYVHKGIEHLLNDQPLERAARIVSRVSGDSAVAYGLAFARAVEAATGTEPPPRAHHLRALMAELERIANHFGDVGAVCNDAAFAFLYARCGELRENVLRTAEACFGHRLMMDCIVPGGVTTEWSEEAAVRVLELVVKLRKLLRRLMRVYDGKASLQDRTVSTGRLSATLARRYGAGGFVGRASDRSFDARRCPGYAPYESLDFMVPTLAEGDVNARVWIRLREIEASLGLLARLIASMPPGEVRVPLAPTTGDDGMEREGMALVEGFRGEVLVWLRLSTDGTRVRRCHPRDPSWFQWPLLEAAIDGNIVPDFPLCNKSFNCSYAGQDL